MPQVLLTIQEVKYNQTFLLRSLPAIPQVCQANFCPLSVCTNENDLWTTSLPLTQAHGPDITIKILQIKKDFYCIY